MESRIARIQFMSRSPLLLQSHSRSLFPRRLLLSTFCLPLLSSMPAKTQDGANSSGSSTTRWAYDSSSFKGSECRHNSMTTSYTARGILTSCYNGSRRPSQTCFGSSSPDHALAATTNETDNEQTTCSDWSCNRSVSAIMLSWKRMPRILVGKSTPSRS